MLQGSKTISARDKGATMAQGLGFAVNLRATDLVGSLINPATDWVVRN
jgi:hypothetical protein